MHQLAQMTTGVRKGTTSPSQRISVRDSPSLSKLESGYHRSSVDVWVPAHSPSCRAGACTSTSPASGGDTENYLAQGSLWSSVWKYRTTKDGSCF